MTREDWQYYEKIQNDEKVLFAMRARCEEQGHELENCCSVMFQIYQRCKWCGEKR
jgi:hypothetical protein